MMKTLVAVAALLAAACETTETRVAPGGETHAVSKAGAADDVPANVIEAAKKAVPGLVVTGSESEVERGVRIYDIVGIADGTSYEIEVTADGKVTEIEKGLDDDDGEDDDGEDEDEDES